MMNEKLFQLIWKHSLYNPSCLKTVSGEDVTVIHPGRQNLDAGPDFIEAKVRVGKTLLVGNVELHIHTSDWFRHKHQGNPAYSNLILHVVYHNDVPYTGNDHIPLLSLEGHIPHHIIDNYCGLHFNERAIPCGPQLGKIKSITREVWLNRLIAERWEMKMEEWNEMLTETRGDWRTFLYWRIASNFGFKINADPFLQLARSLDINILARHKENLFQLEALLFGQAGMLERTFSDEYPSRLRDEYLYLKAKYKLTPVASHLWKFMRLRPANFPTVRIAQFAALVHRSVHLFTQIVSAPALADVSALFQVTAGDYWDNHFRFDEPQQNSAPKHLGKDSVMNIIINSVAPVQYMFALKSGTAPYDFDTAFHLLEKIPAETNAVITEWKQYGWPAANAAQSQALLQLYTHYCQQKRCGECSIGHVIIKSGP